MRDSGWCGTPAFLAIVNYEPPTQTDTTTCTAKRLRSMLKYFCRKKKSVHIIIDLDNSMGYREVREYRGVPIAWEVKVIDIGDYLEFEIAMTLRNRIFGIPIGTVTVNEFLSPNWYFVGVGQLEYKAGPINKFRIEWD